MSNLLSVENNVEVTIEGKQVVIYKFGKQFAIK